MKTISDFARREFLAAALLLIQPCFSGAATPSQTTLRAPTEAQVSVGSASGSLIIPAGRTVAVVQVEGDQVRIDFGGAEAWVPRADTDFEDRLMAQNAAAAAVQAASDRAQIADAQQQQASAYFQSKLDGYVSPLDRGPYDQNRSVVDYYDECGNRYNVGVFGQRIYN